MYPLYSGYHCLGLHRGVSLSLSTFDMQSGPTNVSSHLGGVSGFTLRQYVAYSTCVALGIICLDQVQAYLVELSGASLEEEGGWGRELHTDHTPMS